MLETFRLRRRSSFKCQRLICSGGQTVSTVCPLFLCLLFHSNLLEVAEWRLVLNQASTTVALGLPPDSGSTPLKSTVNRIFNLSARAPKFMLYNEPVCNFGTARFGNAGAHCRP